MQEFFIDYGLWLLIALLVVIVIIFLLSGSRKCKTDDLADAPAVLVETLARPAPVAPTPLPIVEPAVVPTASPAIAPVPAQPVTVAAEPIPISPAAVAPIDQPDDLLQLKGVGPKLNTLLIELNVTSFAQIAGWTDADIAAIDARLGNFKGRPVRDQWVDQAKYLAGGDVAGFEAKYGKL